MACRRQVAVGRKGAMKQDSMGLNKTRALELELNRGGRHDVMNIKWGE